MTTSADFEVLYDPGEEIPEKAASAETDTGDAADAEAQNPETGDNGLMFAFAALVLSAAAMAALRKHVVFLQVKYPKLHCEKLKKALEHMAPRLADRLYYIMLTYDHNPQILLHSSSSRLW